MDWLYLLAILMFFALSAPLALAFDTLRSRK